MQTRDTPGGESGILLRRQQADVQLILLLAQLISTIGALARSHEIRVGATQVELLHDAAAPRNPALASHMARLRLAEMSGLGLDRAFREIVRLGKEPPLLEDGPRFRVVMPGGAGDEVFARFIHSPSFPANLNRDIDVLLTLTALRHSRTLDAADLSGRLQRNTSDVVRTLHRMRDAGLVEPVTTPNSAGTFAGMHASRTRTYGTISTATS